MIVKSVKQQKSLGKKNPKTNNCHIYFKQSKHFLQLTGFVSSFRSGQTQ